MRKKRLLDSFAILAYLEKENGYERVLDILSYGYKTRSVIMNEINVGESYYIISRKRGVKEAEYFIETVLPNLPIQVHSNSFDHIIEASRIKAEYPISYSDCFAVALAMREKAVIVTGDPEFKMIKNLVEIEWL